MNTEKEYFENFYSSNLYSEEYNLDIKEKDNSFQEQYYNFFSPEHMTNCEFVENFMKIDHTSDFLTKNSQQKAQNKSKDAQNHNDSISTHSSLNLNLITNTNNLEKLDKTNQENLLKNKKGRPMTDSNLIIDEVTAKIYDPDDDPLEYKKARKESAVRSRQKKKESNEYLKSENEILKKENYHLYHENSYLKKEKVFLIDQIKFMQNLIKSNGMIIKSHSCSNENYDIEKNMSVGNSTSSVKSNNSTNPGIVLNGERQKPFTKIFSVFIICILSLFYISFNNTDLEQSNEKIIFKGGSTITLNDDNGRNVSDKSDKNFFQFISCDLALKIILLFVLSVFILNISHVWIWIKNKFENTFHKKLYKKL